MGSVIKKLPKSIDDTLVYSLVVCEGYNGKPVGKVLFLQHNVLIFRFAQFTLLIAGRRFPFFITDRITSR